MSSTPTPSTAGPSLAGRYAAAIALTIGFYLLALIDRRRPDRRSPIMRLGVPRCTGNIWLTITALVLGARSSSRSCRDG